MFHLAAFASWACFDTLLSPLLCLICCITVGLGGVFLNHFILSLVPHYYRNLLSIVTKYVLSQHYKFFWKFSALLKATKFDYFIDNVCCYLTIRDLLSMNVESWLCLSLVEPDFMLLMFPGNKQEDCLTVIQFTSAKNCESMGNLRISFILLL